MRHHGVMATQTIVHLVDDLDNSKADRTVSFAFDGKSYEIDLNMQHIDELAQALQPFIDKARRTRGIVQEGIRRRRASSSTGPDKDKRQAIRSWAQGRGIEISDRGRIASSILEQFEQDQAKPAKKAPAKKAARKPQREMADA